jgi:hypothetical protein
VKVVDILKKAEYNPKYGTDSKVVFFKTSQVHKTQILESGQIKGQNFVNERGL